ncbi:ABC transporter sub-family G-like protein 19 [Sarcoptes scabiei]|uniref:ABC transporter sub-family G-like protein 19 n=1 Tax=Sarcoptes scabiei TaxID=52283 RepID=A0A132AG50_SARSC|nr:ABC transporter sub-family G-like protein 19 [Sarcoptes scabiei]
MGPSGSGKTTLFKCLNGAIRNLAKGSELYINSTEKKIPRVGYVEQHVHQTIVEGLSVGDILFYAFFLKNKFSDRNRLDGHIQMTLNELQLDSGILDRKFGDCSGGEQKRVAIAQELMGLNKPSFLFVDEPTTGLDSQAALLVTQCLKKLSTVYKISVFATIHMPNDETIRLFDQLYILAKGGICIYAGRRINLRKNLRHLLGVEVEPGKPPIEEYLKLASNGIEDSRILKLSEHTLELENERLMPFQDRMRFLPTAMPRKFKNFSIGDFILQFYRLCHIIFFVESRLVLYQLLCYVFQYLFLSTLFDHSMIERSSCYSLLSFNSSCSEVREDGEKGDIYINYQATSMLFLTIIQVTINSILFIPLLKMFRNEHQNYWYSMSTFYWAFILIRFIETSFMALIITSFIYFPTGHHHIDPDGMNWSRFGYFFFYIWIACVYYQSFGQLLSVLFLDHMEISMIVSMVLFAVLSLTNGYLMHLKHTDNILIKLAARITGTKEITDGLLYAFFGLDRCDPSTHYSTKLKGFDVDVDNIENNLRTVYINIAIIRVLTFILMYIRFSLRLNISKLYRSEQSLRSKDHNANRIESDEDGNDNHIEKQMSTIKSNFLNTKETSREKDDSELNFEKFSRHKVIFAWRNLSLFDSQSIKEIRSIEESGKSPIENPNLILKDLNGQFRFGTLNALMGTSGAGKTSLLKILNGRSKTRISDETKFYMSKYTPINICYLTQDVSGHLWPGLTAKQSLIYASKLKNCDENQKIDHIKIAWKLLNELEITDTADTMSQNCSGGEMKRLALALELTSVRMPNFICIDEPTSGLDSNSATIVIECLRKLVHRNNITIVASIHQPSTEMLMIFDYCYVLARGGVCLYFGSPNHIPQHLIEVPETGWSPEIDSYPVEELIKYSCYNYTDELVKKFTEITKIKILKEDEEVFEQTQQIIDGIQMNRTRFSMKSVWFLLCRYSLCVKNYLWIYLIVYMLMCLLYGIVARISFNSRIALVDGCIDLEEDFLACNLSASQMEQQRWYTPGAFYLMKSIIDLLPIVPVLLIYITIINIYESVRPGIYWWLCFIMFLAVINAQGCAHLLALLNLNRRMIDWQATILTITSISYFFFLTLLSNFYNPIGKMHYIFQFLANFSFIRWANEAIMLLEYGFDRCGSKQIQAVLHFMMIPNDQYFYRCLNMLIFNIIIIRFLAILLLIFKSRPLENRRRRAKKILHHHQQMKPCEAIIPGLASHIEFSIKQINI